MKSTIAFYNTENFFDTEDDPEKFDNEFTPDGSRKWTQKRYENKVWKISHLLNEIGKNETGEPPAIIGLAEIENRKVLNDLIQSENLKQFDYQFIHFESKDERGIDNAVLFRPEKVKLLHSEPLQYIIPEDFTRDVVYTKFQLTDFRLHLMVVHLPSRRDDDLNRDFRNLILNKIKLKTTEILQSESNAYILVMGDFNGNPDDPDAHGILKTNGLNEIADGEFFNPMVNLMKNGGSLKHKGQWILFDQMLFSKSFLSEKSSGIKIETTKIYNEKSIQDWDRKFKGSPFRTFAGTKYLGGYSDHFPVYTILNY
jgi:endonuclease/exonuclease/phosphatase family metal-dependent hydrolase